MRLSDCPRLTAFIAVLGFSSIASADLPIVVPAEDTGTQALASRRIVNIAIWSEWLHAYEDIAERNLLAQWFQLSAGPIRATLPLRGATLGPLDHWMGRIRGGMVYGGDRGWVAAPLTFAVQRLSDYEILALAPVAHVQSGIEIALSTPWLSNRKSDPGPSFAALHGPDSELAGNGFSLRPLSWHIRVDIPACRSYHFEAGLGSEVFRSTEDSSLPLDIGLRWHASLGLSPACAHQRNVFFNDLTMAFQYRGRAIVYREPLAPTSNHNLSLILQYQANSVAFAIYGGADPASIADYLMMGFRMQIRLGGPK